jgi:cytochrome bd-type quinol oxidase subunit 2
VGTGMLMLLVSWFSAWRLIKGRDLAPWQARVLVAMTFSGWLPLAFAGVMALSMLIYLVLDGYDLGVGVLLRRADDEAQKDTMIASIGPFWDANETWLVLGVGVLKVAFPMANGVILGHLYLPVALMLMALTLRGVAFDFRGQPLASACRSPAPLA